MSFIRKQIEDILSGGFPVLWGKICAFPRWSVNMLKNSRLFYYACKLGVAIKPNSARFHAHLAKLLISMGRFDEAFNAWELAFKLKPDWTEAHNRIQKNFFLCGQNWAAQKIMQNVLDVRNDFARAHQLDKLGIRFLSEFPTAIGHIALLDS